MTDTTPQARARATWTAGDYERIARRLTSAGESIVRHTAVAAGDRVLDVACGTGNATLPAARTGARVTGLDLTPALLERAARAAGDLEIEWIEGDAQALPFGDASFDVVLSTFGAMFAPDQERTAAELARVLRPGGRLGMCNWAPDGATGDMFATVARHVPLAAGRAELAGLGRRDARARAARPARAHALLQRASTSSSISARRRRRSPSTARTSDRSSWRASSWSRRAPGLPLADDLGAFYERWSLVPDAIVYRAEYLVVQGTRAETGAAGHR